MRRRPAHLTRTSSWPGTCLPRSPSDGGSPHEDHGRPAGDRPEDWAAPGAALVRSVATDRIPALADLGRVNIMGIAGSEMERAGPHLFDRGVPVSGCGAREPITVAGLRALGGDVVIGHSPRHLDDTGTFVFTTAINPRHEELVATRESGKAGPAPGRRAGGPPVRRGSRHPRQTPPTSLLVVALQPCGLDPSSFANEVLVERPGQSASGDTHAA